MSVFRPTAGSSDSSPGGRAVPRKGLRARRPAPRAGGPRARRAVRLLAVVGLSAAVLAPLRPAEAVPEQVLQAVSVQLAPDGSITGIDSEAVRQSGSEDAQTETTALDPTEFGGKLPVRVLTSYRLGERSGTDLRDIEGESGRVVIDVTVQNTTVRPQEVDYETSTGDRATATALIGTPLTVVGSAALGEGGFSEVITNNDAKPSEVTDGVVSQGVEGTQVQWAAMLAPPRLAPSATFTLVQETGDFVVPTFDFSVQPGLVTDTSVSRLIDSAFSDDTDSTLQLESRTISIIGNVNTVLTDASTVLDDIQGTLTESAGELGDRTVGELREGRDRVDSSLTSTISELESLSDQIDGELASTGDQTLAGLDGTIDDVRRLLGDPSAEQQPELEVAADCEARVPGREAGYGPGEGPRSVLYQMRLVGAQLDAMSTVSRACSADIKQDLLTTIGKVDADCDRIEYADTAICALEDTVNTLDERSAELVAFGSDLHDLANPDESLDTLGSKLAELTSELSLAQTTKRNLGAALGVSGADGIDVGEVYDELDQVSELVDELLLGEVRADGSRAEPLLDDIEDALSEISDEADDQIDALGLASTEALRSRVGELLSILDTSCGIEQSALPSELAGLLGGIVDCEYPDDETGQPRKRTASPDEDTVEEFRSAVEAELGDLESVIAGQIDAWNDVKDQADVDSQIGEIRDELERIRDVVGTERDGGGDPGGLLAILLDIIDRDGNSEELYTTLSSQLDQLYDGRVGGDGQCAVEPAQRTSTTSDRPLNVIQDAYAQVTCNTRALQTSVDGKIGEFQGIIGATGADVTRSARQTNRARKAAARNVEQLTGKLARRIGESGDTVVARTENRIEVNHSELDASQAAAQVLIQRLTSSAAERLATSVVASNRDVSSTNRQLQGDLTNVLLDLGTRGPDGTGILGTLSSSARRTGLSNSDLVDVSRQAGAFRSIRGQEVADIRLQQAQTDRSIELSSQFPSFGLDVPAGSRVLTVFSIRIGGQ